MGTETAFAAWRAQTAADRIKHIQKSVRGQRVLRTRFLHRLLWVCRELLLSFVRAMGVPPLGPVHPGWVYYIDDSLSKKVS